MSISDFDNSRILFFSDGSTDASRVYGQGGSLTSGVANYGGAASASTLSQVAGIALDAHGGLYAADTHNNRVLYFPPGSTTAMRVYGQYGDAELALLMSIGQLADAESATSSTLNTAVSTLAPIAAEYAQPFSHATDNAGGVSAFSLHKPYGVLADPAGGLYVADAYNHRVLYYEGASTVPTRVYGQLGSFTSALPEAGGGPSACLLYTSPSPRD